MSFLSSLILLLSLFFCSIECGPAIELTNSDFEATIKQYDLVLVDFHARWCKFSRMLDPVFDEASQALDNLYKDSNTVKLAKVDCEKENEVARKYGINKYPTIKMFENGKVSKKEYRGSRTKDAFVSYITKYLESPIKDIPNLDDIPDLLEKQKHNVIGYFDNKESADYKHFDRVARMLRHDCGWFAAFGEVAKSQKQGGTFQIVYKPPNVEHGEKLFSSSLKTHDLFLAWATDKCVPLVRVITFENAEELTEEGIPFLILFHKPDDTESPRKYTEVVQKQLFKRKESVTFLTADGVQFAHPLHHMGKQIKDLPVLAIDSFKHMYVFPDNDKMFDADALNTFISDLETGKLHREFHHGPDVVVAKKAIESKPQETKGSIPVKKLNVEIPTATRKAEEEVKGKSTDGRNARQDQKAPPSTPPESQFAKLAPSDLRYSFRDEL